MNFFESSQSWGVLDLLVFKWFGEEKVQIILLKNSTCLYDFPLSLDNCCSHWLCISACAPVTALAAQASKVLGALFLLYSQAQHGIASLGSDPIDTWPVASTYPSCGSHEFCLAFPLHAPLLSPVYHALFLEQDEYFPGFSVFYFVLCLVSVYWAF